LDEEFLAVVREAEVELLVLFKVYVEDVAQVIVFGISDLYVLLCGVKTAQILIFGHQFVENLGSEFTIGLAAVHF